MLQETSLGLFLAASLVVIVAPGPDNILVLTRGITMGRGAGLVSAAGASAGLVTHSVFAAAGLSALLASSAVAFAVVKYVGKCTPPAPLPRFRNFILSQDVVTEPSPREPPRRGDSQVEQNIMQDSV